MEKYKVSLTNIVSLLLVVTLLLAVNSTYSQEVSVIFTDDFESYSVGSLPPTWEFWFNQNGEIVSGVSVSGHKSLKLRGSYGWAVHAVRRFSTNADIIGYEVYVMVAGYGKHRDRTTAGVLFIRKTGSTTSAGYASVHFRGDGYIYTAGKRLLRYYPKTWYKIRVVYDRRANEYSVYINDKLIASNVTCKCENPYAIEGLSLNSDWGEEDCYFDDVKVFIVRRHKEGIFIKDPGAGCLYVFHYDNYLLGYVDFQRVLSASVIANYEEPLGEFTAIRLGFRLEGREYQAIIGVDEDGRLLHPETDYDDWKYVEVYWGGTVLGKLTNYTISLIREEDGWYLVWLVDGSTLRKLWICSLDSKPSFAWVQIKPYDKQSPGISAYIKRFELRFDGLLVTSIIPLDLISGSSCVVESYSLVPLKGELGRLEEFTIGNVDAHDLLLYGLSVEPGQTLPIRFSYKEGYSSGINYIIRVYPEWSKDSFVLNSDNNELNDEVGSEIGGGRFDEDNLTVPTRPGVYRIRVVGNWARDEIPEAPSWDEYQRLLGEFYIRVVKPAEPPSLTLFSPEVNELTVTVNGVATPGTPDATITRIHWDWGDGTEEDSWFPAVHTYENPGTYTVTVTVYQSDGLTTTKTLTITVKKKEETGSPPPSREMPRSGEFNYTFSLIMGICLVIVFVLLVSSVRRKATKVSPYQKYLEKLEELYREGKVSRQVYEELKRRYEEKLRRER